MVWLGSTVHLFLRFDGRIGRGRFWAGLFTLAFIGSGLVVFGPDLFAARGGSGTDIWLVFLALLLGVWMLAALMAKRLHDGNRTGWLFLLYGGGPIILARFGDGMAAADNPVWAPLACYLAALILVLWSLVDLGARPGTRGANRFGPASRAH